MFNIIEFITNLKFEVKCMFCGKITGFSDTRGSTGFCGSKKCTKKFYGK